MKKLLLTLVAVGLNLNIQGAIVTNKILTAQEVTNSILQLLATATNISSNTNIIGSGSVDTNIVNNLVTNAIARRSLGEPFWGSKQLVVVILGDSQTAGDNRTPGGAEPFWPTWEIYLRTNYFTNANIIVWTNISLGGGSPWSNTNKGGYAALAGSDRDFNGVYTGTALWASTNYDRLVGWYTPATRGDVEHSKYYILFLPLGVNDCLDDVLGTTEPPVETTLNEYSNICARAKLDGFDKVIGFTVEATANVSTIPLKASFIEAFNRGILSHYAPWDTLIPWHAYFNDYTHDAYRDPLDGTHWNDVAQKKAADLAIQVLQSGSVGPNFPSADSLRGVVGALITPFSLPANMDTKWGIANRSAVITSNTPLSLSLAEFFDIWFTTNGVTNAYFYFTNYPSGGIYNRRTFAIHSGESNVSFSFPTNINWASAVPSNLTSYQFVKLQVDTVGSSVGRTYVTASGAYTDLQRNVTDPDALQFFGRGTSFTETEMDAVNQLVIDLKAGGFWDRMDIIYPCVGIDIDSQSLNLKQPRFDIVWTTRPVYSTNGLTGDGRAYGSTQFQPYTEGLAGSYFTTNSAHMFFYNGNPNPGYATIWMAGTETLINDDIGNVGNQFRSYGPHSWGCDVVGISVASFNGQGIVSRTSSTNWFMAINSQSVSTNCANASIGGPGVGGQFPYIGFLIRLTDSNIPEGAVISRAQCRGASIGGSISLAEWGSYKTIWDTFNNTLGRKTP